MKWVMAALKYVLLAALLFCIGHMMSLSVPLSDTRTPVIYYIPDGTMTLSRLDEMREEENALDDAVPFASYSRIENQNFENPDLGRTLSAPVLCLYGDSSLILSTDIELFADDTEGCLLSSAAAWELFGETSVSSGAIIYENRSYIVRGVYHDEDPVVIVSVRREQKKTQQFTEDYDESAAFEASPEEAEEGTFDRILIRPTGNAARRLETIHAFENRHGFGSEKTDCGVYVRMGSVLAGLIPFFVFVIFIWLAISRIIMLRRRPFWLVIACGAAALAFCAFFFVFRYHPRIPVDLIPNRWSDFEFWGEKITVMISSIRHMFFAGKNEVELNYFRPLVDMAGYSICSIVLFVICDVWFRKTMTSENFLLMLFMTCITEGVTIFILITGGISAGSWQLLLYLWPFLLVIRFIFGKNGLLDVKNVDFRK